MASVARRLDNAASIILAALLIAAGGIRLPAKAAAPPDSLPSPSNLQRAYIAISPQPQKIATRTILPNTIKIYADTTGIAWHLDSSLTHITFSAPPDRYGDSVSLAFRTIRLPLHARYAAKALLPLLSPDSALAPLLPESRSRQATPSMPPIVIKGIAERALGVGTLAYAAPTSGMINLSIRGPLYHATQFEAHIVDNSLPFQPEGTSARIENINRLFLRVFDSAWCIEAGDISIEESQGHFLRQREETKGIGGAWRGEASAWDSLAVRATLGTAKGEIERTDIQPLEGIQGPYALMGSHEFTQVMVQAGTERVFLDGEMLTRGELNDYTIDYNLGSITFTAKRPINRLSRIVVEYETSQRTYTRLLGHISTGAKNRDGWQLRLKAYFAQDRAASLPDELKDAGALEHLAAPLAQNKRELLLQTSKRIDGKTNSGYIEIDTTSNGQRYAIYRYCPAGQYDSLLSIPFSYVGPNQGDYQLTQLEYNDRIFRWVAPTNGTPRGDYAPGRRVPTPTSHAMVESTIAKQWLHTPAELSLTAAYTLLNENTLGNQRKRQSYALELSQNARIARYGADGLYLQSHGRWVANDFTPTNRFLPLEFHRSWGENEISGVAPWAEAAIALASRASHTHAQLKGELLWRPNATAWRGSTEVSFSLSSWKYSLIASALLRNADSARSARGAIATSISRAFRYIRIQGNAISEWLIPLRRLQPSRLAPYAFAEGGVTVALTDTIAIKASLRANYRRTWDTAAHSTLLQPRADALEGLIETSAPIGAHGLIKGCVTARATFPTAAYRQDPRSLTLLTSLNYGQAVARQRLRISAMLTLSSELLPKWQFHFIPVAIGQGTHAWIDANQDGKPQLDEFFPAQHADQALYVKQTVASSEQQKALAATSRLALNFSPRPDNRPIDSLTLWWHRVDISLTLEHAAKRTDGHIGRLFDPLEGSAPIALPERQRAMLIAAALNKNAGPLFFTYSFTLSDYRQTIAQGITSNSASLHRIALETPRRKGLGGCLLGEFSKQEQLRPYASQAAESITARLAEAALIWRSHSDQSHELNATFGWIALQPNHLKVKSQRYTYRFEIPLDKKWQVAALASYCRVAGDPIGRHALAYQALKGNTNGNNFNAQATVSYKITEFLDLNVTYTLRKNGSSPTINAGFATLRAAF